MRPLLALLFLVACGTPITEGPSDSDGDGILDTEDKCPTTPGDPRRDDGCRFPLGEERPVGGDFFGAWDGSLFFAPEGLASIATPERLGIATVPNSKRAMATGLCPDGSGSLELKDTGRGPEWSGIYICPPANVGACKDAGVILFSLYLQIDNGVLRGDGEGTWRGCGVTGPMTFAFTGVQGS